MADSNVPITPGTGANVDTFTQANGDHRQAIVIGDANAATVAGFRPDGRLQIDVPFRALLSDTFESGIDTVRWTTGGTVIPAVTTGVLGVNPGTTANASSWLISKPVFPQLQTAYMVASMVVRLSAANETNSAKFWGFGVITTPTNILPVTNGAGFELINGLLTSAIYSNGVRTMSTALTRPTDGTWHRYAVYFRSSRAYFEIDGVVVATHAYPSPSVTTLSLVATSVNGGTAATNQQLEASVLGVADSNNNHTQLSDGIYPWRKATIDASGALRSGPTAASTSALTSVTAATASTALLTANANRLHATFTNDSSAACYLALSGTASTTAYTVMIPAGGYYELPGTSVCYTGAVSAIWAAATGAVRITELST